MIVSGELIRLFYELWESAQGGCEYLETAPSLPESLEKLPRSNAGEIHRALRNLNRIGHLTEYGGLPGDFAAGLVGKEAIRAITKAMPLIEEARARREEPDYLQYIDKLLAVCRQAYPDYEPKYLIEEQHPAFGLAREAR